MSVIIKKTITEAKKLWSCCFYDLNKPSWISKHRKNPLGLVSIEKVFIRARFRFPKSSFSSKSCLWNYLRKISVDIGFREKWFENGIEFEVTDSAEVQSMPVPSSYNDISVSSSVRDFLGWAWYERDFFVPQRWKSDNLEVRIRFGSVHYTALGLFVHLLHYNIFKFIL
jgi:hypothetical protein